MNLLDIDWLSGIKKEHPENFKDVKVLELGSRDCNGNAWDLFENCEMTGVDWLEGKNVTLLMKCADTDFEKDVFDTVISLNHLEHDPYWEQSLSHNFPALKENGLLILRWADINSSKHSLDSDPSGTMSYHPKALNEVSKFVRNSNFTILLEGSKQNDSIGMMSFLVARKK